MDLDFSFFGYSPKPKEKRLPTPARAAFTGRSKLALQKLKSEENTPTVTMPVGQRKTLVEETIVLDDSEVFFEGSNARNCQYRLNPNTIVLSDSSDEENSPIDFVPRVKKPSKVVVYSTSDTNSSQDSFRKNNRSTLCQKRKVIIESSSEIEDEDQSICRDATFDKQRDLPLLTSEKERDINKWLNAYSFSDDETEKNKAVSEDNKEKTETPVVHFSNSSESEKNDRSPLPTAVQDLLDELYGPTWKSARKTTVISSSGSEDSFDRMMKRENQPSVFRQTAKLPETVPHPPINRKLTFDQEEQEISATLTKPIPKSKPLGPKKPSTKAKPRTPAIRVAATLPVQPVSVKSDEQLRSFLESLSTLTPANWCDPKALDYRTNFKTKKEELTRELFQLFNKNVFEGRLPADMLIEWNVRLNKTAGYCYNRSSRNVQTGVVTRSSRIEMSTKVCNSADRLRDTLVHEMCHAANWIVGGVSNGHGASWKAWAARAMRRFKELPVIARCHAYKIDTKYTYKCTVCGYSIGRHSKSLDIDAKRCGYCRGTFQLLVNTAKTPKNGGNPVTRTPKAASGFALYVKENYSSVKKDQNHLKHGDVMKLLGKQFSATKITN